MKTRIPNPLFLILLLCGCLTCVEAADHNRFTLQDSDGFAVTLPNVNHATVTLHLKDLQQDLKTRVALLKQEVQRKSFKTFDTLVTVVMPGGLLYAKLRMDAHKLSKQRLNHASNELELISGELVAFQAENGELIIATID